MSKILLVDTNVSAAPIYDHLLASGDEVFVIGGNPNDFLAKTAGNYIRQDYADVAKVRDLVDEIGIDYLVPGCNDRSYMVCAELNVDARFGGLDSLESAATINNKEKFRRFAESIGLPIPRLLDQETYGDCEAVIVKPVDAFSGRGISVLRKPDALQLQSAIAHAREFSLAQTCIVEEYVDGPLFSHTATIVGGRIVADFIVEEHGTANPFVVDTSRLVYDFSLTVLAAIREAIERMAQALACVDGLVHTQFICKGDAYWIIEVTRRCPGDLYSQLIELSTAYKYAEIYAQPFVDRNIRLGDYVPKQSWVMRHTISQTSDAFFGSLRFSRALLVEKLVSLGVTGDYVKASPFGRIGILFVRAETGDELESIFASTLSRSLYTMQSQMAL
jgi:glutathione synthase/RimK-type ligase-like ATP-grasp enzyme